ncbi:hypothetical protein SCLCIDRAFT_14030 [Scleroderma citrinum Foug A]|uniref:Helicase ATP-binding domain-containing protein n=1 Tax=Scleroderma citrinum Foug A TaxID=1036808 RepID=A0A0C3EGN6_9AGAM|nr:hypothetical protein SCLCIDRAFT_14030 [Scleroderma citrinum Foug A]
MNVAKAIIMGLNSEPKKHIIIISPLDALEHNQARSFELLGLMAAPVNGQTYSPKLQKALEEQKYQVIITSPEMCLKHDGFRGVISNPKFAHHIAAIVIDEAHCILQWGDKFHEEYSKLSTLQAFMPSHVPVLVTSATMPPPVLSQVCITMHIDMAKMKHMKAGKSDLEALQFIPPQSCRGKGNENDFKQTMIFGDNINTLMAVCKWVQDNSPVELHEQVAIYNSRLTPCARQIVLKRFEEGKIKVLFTTEAAGMVGDLFC